MKILIVEDEKDLLNAMVDYLHQSGMSCHNRDEAAEVGSRVIAMRQGGIDGSKSSQS